MRQTDMLKAPIRSVFFSYLAPSVSATLVTSIYILADTMMIGRGVGASGIAALNLLLPLYSAYYGFGMMCGVGGSVLFGFSRGKGDEEAAKGYFTTALLLAVLLAAASIGLCAAFFDPLLILLGDTPSLNPYSVPYGRVLVAGSPVFVFSSFLQAFVRNDGAPKLAMAGVISGGVTNVILDYVFIFPLGQGMAGAALATVMGTCLTVLILCTHFFSKENHLKLAGGFSLKRAFAVASNGLASFILEMSGGFVTFIFNRQLLAYVGETGVVVYSIISNAALVVKSISNGIAQAAQPLNLHQLRGGRAWPGRRGQEPGDPDLSFCRSPVYRHWAPVPGASFLSVPGSVRRGPFHGGSGDPALFYRLYSGGLEYYVRHLLPGGGEAPAGPCQYASAGDHPKQPLCVPSSGLFRS